MGMFRGLGLSLSNEDPVAVTLELAREADRLGFDEVSLPESRLIRSVTSVAAAVLASTSDITVRIGIANPVNRHPAVLALEASTLADLAPGRLRFGVGAAEWTLKALGMAPPGWKPYTNTVETVRAMKDLLAGDALSFEPTTFLLGPDARLENPPASPPPIDLGAVSGRTMEAVGRWADGVQLGAITSVGYTRWARERIEEGAHRAGRSTDDLLISANVLTSVDEDRDAARNAVRDVLAYYIARVEGVVITESGADPAHIEEVRRAVREEGFDAGAAAVTDHLIDVFAVAGTVDEVVEGLAEYAEAGLGLPLAWYTLGPDPVEATRVLGRLVRPAVTG